MSPVRSGCTEAAVCVSWTSSEQTARNSWLLVRIWKYCMGRKMSKIKSLGVGTIKFACQTILEDTSSRLQWSLCNMTQSPRVNRVSFIDVSENLLLNAWSVKCVAHAKYTKLFVWKTSLLLPTLQHIYWSLYIIISHSPRADYWHHREHCQLQYIPLNACVA